MKHFHNTELGKQNCVVQYTKTMYYCINFLKLDFQNKRQKSSFLVHLPFQLVIGPRREGRALDDLSHLLTTEAEVVDGPHVRELHHFDLAKKK